MKLLIKAALRARRHFYLLILTFVTLIGFTLSNSFEMLTLGVITNTGVDFFTLFSEKDQNSVHHATIDAKWPEIDVVQKGHVTRQDVNHYISQKKKGGIFQWALSYVKTKFHLDGTHISSFILLLISVALFKACFLFLSRFTTQLLSVRISRDLRQEYFEHIQSLPMSFYQQYNIGTLSSRVVGDANQIALSTNSFITNYFHAPFNILLNLTFCFLMSWQLSLVIFVGLPLIVFPVMFVTKRVKRVTRQLQRNQEQFSNVLIDFLAGIQTVKIFAMETFSLKKYKEQNDHMARLEIKTAKYDLLTRPILHTITTFCLASVIIVGLYILKLSVAELVVFVGLLHLFYEPVKKFAEENANIQKGVVAAERLYEVLHLKPHIEDIPNAIDIASFNDEIAFERIWFKYEDSWVLKDLSFTVKKGETVAIVGATGAGKSTIVQLIPRLYEVQQGQITIDGLPLDAYTQKSLRELIAFVSQKPFLFYDTISANISYGQPLPQKAIEDAARRAHAAEFIERLPKRYETQLAEMGKNFSGGQQQRLAIARALAKKAPILILDEATSSLDSLSESHIKEAVKELHGSITQILIAHRLSTIEHADKIVFLENGTKIAEGTKEELLHTCPPFKLMWDLHFRSQSSRAFHS